MVVFFTLFLILLNMIEISKSELNKKVKFYMYDLPENIKYEWFATNHYPSCIRWIAQWLAVSQTDDRFSITFTDHSEFEKSNSGLIKIILENFSNNMHFDLHKIQQPEVGKSHFRRGLNDEWRDCFTPALQKWMNSLIPQDQCAKFQWPMA